MRQRRVHGEADSRAEASSTAAALCTAMLVYREEGCTACAAFLEGTDLRRNLTFKMLVAVLVHTSPHGVHDKKGRFVVESSRLALPGVAMALSRC